MDDARRSRANDERAKSPRMLRLVIVCLLVWVVCGLLVWINDSYLDNCCDVSMFSKLFH